ncbi:MAG: hypothetical protein ACRDDY_08465 [Clostridium sp.]|uniref:hypothetical protein n=1 Tax=Clostridium sp. TaxID=1506 RepID=UPI003EE5EC33
MKILLIGFTKLAYMPYMRFYLDQINNLENEVHLLYWNRDEKDEIKLPYDITLHEFKLYQEDEVAKVKKIKSFLKYRENAKKILLNQKFDLIIVMHTIPGVILYDILKNKYKYKYILDYRDITFENIGIYKNVINKLVKNSIATFVSSEGFKRNLPNVKKIYTSHNILLDSLNKKKIRDFKAEKRKIIRIRYWGFIRQQNINKLIIDRLANDIRFELHYHGREQTTANVLKKYCEENNIKNVYFHGKYNPENRYDFAKKTDLIHNIYENDRNTKLAMANKFYDGITLNIPQICNSESYMGKQIEENEIGLAYSPVNKDFADVIYNYYNSLKWEEFDLNCNKKLNEILIEYKNGVRLINRILQKNKN